MARARSNRAALAWLLAPWAQLAGALRAQERLARDAPAAPGTVELDHLVADIDDELERPRKEEQLALRNDPNVSFSHRVHEVTNIQECGGALTLRELGYDSSLIDAEEETLPIRLNRGYPVDPKLDGRQICEGHFKRNELNGRVALVLTGEAFRTRNFFTRRKHDCTDPSLHAQRRLAESHLANIVAPIEEELKLKVDVYLSITPCSYEPKKGVLEEAESSFNIEETLRRLYGGERVKGIFAFNRSAPMYDKLAGMHVSLDQAMHADGPAGTGVYEYFIMWRYDVYMNRRFTELIPNRNAAHGGLAFYMSAHDFAWSFPGEMWNCMKRFWDVCMRGVKSAGIKEVDLDGREALGCFSMGPMTLPTWVSGCAFDSPLKAIGRVARWRGSTPAVKLRRGGCSAFDVRGDEHRCHSDWFWPPKESWEHRFMPYYYHLA